MKIYEDQFKPSPEIIEAFVDFYAIVGQLRRDCPWDREQTHESVRHMMIEETYEAVEAIDNQDWDELSRELGDVFLHVLFHSDIGATNKSFTLLEVMQRETEKLVRRHPHVFGDVQVNDVGEVLTNWEEIKQKETGRRSAIDGIPKHLPALLRAYRLQEKAGTVGFDFPNGEENWAKVEEEIAEYKALVMRDASVEEQEKEFGDVMFAMVNYARFAGMKPENALRQTNAKFERRFRYIEEQLAAQGKRLKDVTLEEMDRYWDEAKAKE